MRVNDISKRFIEPQQGKDNYFYKIDASEMERLKILNHLLNKDTLELLDSAPLKLGNTILELGCGLGIISVELARRVGSKGEVIAVDYGDLLLGYATQYAKAQGISNVLYKKLNIYDIDAQTFGKKFDVIYGRYIVMNLSNPEEELKRLLGLLNKGGTIILEEGIISHSFCYPEHPAFAQWQDALKSSFKKDKKDSDFGLQLPLLFKKNGLQIYLQRVRQPLLHSPEERSLISRVFLNSKDALSACPKFSHIVTELKNLEKQENVIGLGTTFQIIGKK
jgi:SAM-dependent methyltransferase